MLYDLYEFIPFLVVVILALFATFLFSAIVDFSFKLYYYLKNRRFVRKNYVGQFINDDFALIEALGIIRYCLQTPSLRSKLIALIEQDYELYNFLSDFYNLH